MNLKAQNRLNGKFEKAFVFNEGYFDLEFSGGILIKKKPSGQGRKGFHFFPPFYDTHMHFMGYALLKMSVDCLGLCSIEDIVASCTDHMTRNRSRFIIAERWDENYLKDKRYIRREDLDRISRRIPVIARRLDGHVLVCNSAAGTYLAARRIPVPSDGIIKEKYALNIYNYFDFQEETIMKGFIKARAEAYRLGITGSTDYLSGNYYRFYRKIIDHVRDFDISYFTMHPFFKKEPAVTEHFRYKGIKLFADGSIGADTACMSFPYLSGKDSPRILLPSSRLTSLLGRYAPACPEISIHAIGDITVRSVLNGVSTLGKEKKKIRLEHLEFVDAVILRSLKNMGLRVSLQPNFIGMWGVKGGMYEKKFGPVYKKNNPVHSIMAHAGLTAFGSDGMPFSPSYGIFWSMNHPDRNERISFSDAISA